jgi:hypothetical protein
MAIVGSLNIARFQNMDSNIHINENVLFRDYADRAHALQSCGIFGFIPLT